MRGAELARYLSEEPWDSLTYKTPRAALSAIGMSKPNERTMLSWLTATVYRGEGEIVELGAFVGASSVALACGLGVNPLPAPKKNKRIHVFDKFRGNFEQKWIQEHPDLKLDEDMGFLGAYRQQTNAFERFIEIYRGDVREAKWNGAPIEILYVDAAKGQEETSRIVQEFFPYLIPGRSVLIMQDYLFTKLPYSVVVTEHFADRLVRAGDTGQNNVLFVPTETLDTPDVRNFSYTSISEDTRLHYLMRAVPKQRTHRQREYISHQIADFLSGRKR